MGTSNPSCARGRINKELSDGSTFAAQDATTAGVRGGRTRPVHSLVTSLSLAVEVCMMEEDGTNGKTNGQQPQARGSGTSSAPSALSIGTAQQQRQSFRNDVPVFLDQTFRMIENVPDHIVCWSPGGDSFIVKQIPEFELLLPSYYNHNKFLSFVRQLNFYGFKKVKERESPFSKSVYSPDEEAEAGTPTADPDSWQEFTHPRFRRGRRDLLADIKRQKDAGRHKRKQAELHKSDMLSDLSTKVDNMSDELRAMNGKLDDTLSLLHHNVAVQIQNESNRGGGNSDGGLASGLRHPHGVEVAEGGGANHVGHGPYNHVAPLGYTSHRLAVDQQRLHLDQNQNQNQRHQHGWPGHYPYPHQFQQSPSTQQDLVSSYQTQVRRYDGQTPPPPVATAAARAAEVHANAQSHYQLPSLYPGVDRKSNLAASGHDRGRYYNAHADGRLNSDDGSGRDGGNGVSGAFPPDFTDLHLHGMQQQQHPPQGAWACSLPSPRNRNAAHHAPDPGARLDNRAGGGAGKVNGQAKMDLSRI